MDKKRKLLLGITLTGTSFAGINFKGISCAGINNKIYLN
jgi:hypothetical protein